MEANRRTDTNPELALRSELHRRGFRFRKDMRIAVEGGRVRPDIVFTRARVAVFVDGCFWHRCPIHALDPKSNAAYWQAKFDANVARDRRNDTALERAAWRVVRVWEHEDPTVAAERIAAVVKSAQDQSPELCAAAPQRPTR